MKEDTKDIKLLSELLTGKQAVCNCGSECLAFFPEEGGGGLQGNDRAQHITGMERR